MTAIGGRAHRWPTTVARATATALFAALVSACGPELPDDLPQLIRLMNENNQTISVNSTNRVWRQYGADGLLQALREGEATARAMAAYRLRSVPGQGVEEALMNTARRDPDGFVRTQAVWTLEEIGTTRALPAVEAATRDADPQVARMARSASDAIRTRTATQ